MLVENTNESDINALTGSLALRERKTGVHILHEELLNAIFQDGRLKNRTVVSYYGSKKKLEKEYPRYKSERYANKLKFSSTLARIAAYLIPIEFIFGDSKVYICDGMVPHTLKKRTKIAIVHDLMVRRYPENYSLVRKIYLNTYFRQCLRADHIVTVSNATKKDIIKYLGIPEDKISVVPCGYNPPGEDEEEIADEGAQDLLSRKYLLYFGDMRPNKNLINAIKGFKIAHEVDHDLYFYICGAKNGQYELLRSLVDNMGLSDKVKFLGYVSEGLKNLLYRHGMALLFVSECEGFGIPILEASAYKLPVITSNVSSMKEIADGASVLVDCHDPQAIADGIISLESESARLDVVNRQTEKMAEFTWEKFGMCFCNLIAMSAN